MQFLLNKTVKLKNNSLNKYFNRKKIIKSDSVDKYNNGFDFRDFRKETNTININKKISKKMRKIKQKNRYKRNIYKLLYDQIHSDVAGIEKEIKIGKKLIVPYSVFRNNQLKNELLIKRYLNPITNIDTKNNKKKFVSPEIKNNIIKYNSSIINKSPKKNFGLKTYSSFSNIKKNLVIPNLKTENNTTINLVKSRSNKIRTLTVINNNENNIEKNLSNTEKSNINNAIASSNSLSIELLNSKKSLYKVRSDTQIQKRKKTLYITYDERWYIKNKFINMKLDKNLIENIEIQSQIIHDQFALINENIRIMTTEYIINKGLLVKFSVLNLKDQKAININIEETNGLMIEISHILLEKYESHLQKFMTKILKRIDKDDSKFVDDEKKEFRDNIILYTEACIFFDISYKSYCILIQRDKNYKIDKSNFIKVYQYLDRLRLSMSKLVLDIKNIFTGIYKKEKKIITECVEKILKIKERKDYFDKKKLDCHKKFGEFLNGIDPFKYKAAIRMRYNEDNEINMKINRALGKKNNVDHTFYNIKKFNIGSKLVTDLMGYATKEFRDYVVTERIRTKAFEMENIDD